MIIYYALLFAGSVMGVYDTPAKCERALQVARQSIIAQYPQYAPSQLVVPELKCEKRGLDEGSE